jgi:hypothetical protein
VLALSADRPGWLNVQLLQLSLHRSGCLLSLLITGASLVTACSGTPPSLTALDPPNGHPHEVVFVQGTERESAQIVWDAGTTDEKIIPGGYKGAFMFSVPDDAAPGSTHAVALQNKTGRSNTVTFTIPMLPGPDNIPRPRGGTHEFPPPRIDAVTIVGATFDPAGVSTTLYVQGANLDVGATISMKTSFSAKPVEIAATSHKVLRNDWYGVSHDDLSYPIYHYGSAVAVPGILMPGQRIWLVATNLGGGPKSESEPFPYVLPTDAESLDSDGDSLPDKWETAGYDAEADGVIDVNLPALGADPYRRDLFIELDIMDGVVHRPDQDAEKKPNSTVFDALKGIFESAPIINFGKASGIHLVIDELGTACLPNPAGGEKCSFPTTVFDIGGQVPSTPEPDPFTSGLVRFSSLKKYSFDNEKKGKVYHYGIWGIRQANGRYGYSDDGDDFLISFDTAVTDYHTARSQIEAIAHEFGHNLRQLHAGGEPFPPHVPNYPSVMSYNWLFRTGWPDSLRLDRATCLPYYYAASGAQEGPSGKLPPSVNTIVDYSEGMARPVIRPMPSATTSTSVCGSTITWSTVDAPFNTLKDFANWRALVFDGPVKNGELTP